jgi:hypothetical protein
MRHCIHCALGLLCVLGSIGGLCGGGREVEELSVYYKKETISGTEFVYREDVASGTRKETWSVNGKVVAVYEYEEAFLEAEKELRREELRAEQERRRERQNAQLTVTADLYKKVVRIHIDRVEYVLNRCRDQRLEPFLQFGMNGALTTVEFDEIMDTIAAAKKLLDTRGDDLIESLKAIEVKLEPLPDKLEKLIQLSVDHAVKYCDDTKVLKELLGLVPLG